MSYFPTRQLRGVIVMLDANCINARRMDPSLNQIDQWHKEGVTIVEMAQASHEEAIAGGSPTRARKAMGHVFAMPALTNQAERDRLLEIERILSPGGCSNENERNDVEIVFTAAKYHAILVSRDGDSKSQPEGILGNRRVLSERFGLRVMRPEGAVEWIREKIRNRDELTRIICARTGRALPDWVGRD